MNGMIVKLIVGAIVTTAGMVGISHKWIVNKTSTPDVTTQETAGPARLQERMHAMIEAMQAGDAHAYAANYNMSYLYKLVKGQVEYDANLFGGSAADARRLQQNLSDIAGPEALAEAFAQSVNFDGIGKISLEDIEISEDGTHAKARLVWMKDANRKVVTSPQWHYFDNDWWQIDD
jgi:hypothetical protein